MIIVSSLNEWLALRQSLKGKTIGFVPTMGNLHAGHTSLCKQSKRDNDITVVSIYVNPTQFNEEQDFNLYPRTIEQDSAILAAEQVDYLFLPSCEMMYPDEYHIQVHETTLSRDLEGEYRPGHFTGMLTVVIKLLNLIQATKAYFGEKDYQQYLLVHKMVKALFIPTDVVACPIVRAQDGLPLSSRNSRLTAKERELAASFSRELSSAKSLADIKQTLLLLGFQVDYIAEKWGRRLGAVRLGQVRLLDNRAINEVLASC